MGTISTVFLPTQKLFYTIDKFHRIVTQVGETLQLASPLSLLVLYKSKIILLNAKELYQNNQQKEVTGALSTPPHFNHNLQMGPKSQSVCLWQAFPTKCNVTHQITGHSTSGDGDNSYCFLACVKITLFNSNCREYRLKGKKIQYT